MTIWHLRISCRVLKATNTHSQYVLQAVFHCNNGYTNAPQCYVIRTLPVRIHIALLNWVRRKITSSIFYRQYPLHMTRKDYDISPFVIIVISSARWHHRPPSPRQPTRSVTNLVRQCAEGSQHLGKLLSVISDRVILLQKGISPKFQKKKKAKVT